MKGHLMEPSEQQPIRLPLSALSATGLHDYELWRKQVKLEVPEYFNFASVVLDQ